MFQRSRTALLFGFVLCLPTVAGEWPLKVDAAIQRYHKQESLSGSLNSVGSDTLNTLMALWVGDFSRSYPAVRLQIDGRGSSTGPPALARGIAHLAPMSRLMTDSEVRVFEKARGYLPLRIAVGLDALAVYVNRDNPLESLTLQQVDAIFSKTRRGGYAIDLVTWKQIDKRSPLGGYPIKPYGRNAASGTYATFKQFVLYKGDFKDRVRQQPGSASVIMAVTEDRYGIGYSGMGFRTAGVKTLKLSADAHRPAVAVTAETVLDGSYPLGRRLYIYIDKPPGGKPDRVVAEFMRYVLSREGQWTLAKSGYIPLPPTMVEKQLQLLD